VWRRRTTEPLLPLSDVLEALGDDGDMGRYGDEVPLDWIVGSAARTGDFDASFRPRRSMPRLSDVRRKFDAGTFPPPIELVRLGQLHFVLDGHHRVAVARERNWTALPARVRRICTVAFARCCLTVADLPTVAAERRFLEELPLPDDVRQDVRLESPASWARLRDAALAWGYRRERQDGTDFCCAHDLAAAWWVEEVEPVVRRLRERPGGAAGVGDLSDLQLFVVALAERDGLGHLDWDDPANDEPDCCRLRQPARRRRRWI
jgi:hypothetical protein